MGRGIFMPFSKLMKDPLYSPDSGDDPIAVYNNLSSSIGSSDLGNRKSTSVPGDNSTPFRPEKVGSASNSQPLSEQLLSHFHPLSELLSELSTGDKTTSDTTNGIV